MDDLERAINFIKSAMSDGEAMEAYLLSEREVSIRIYELEIESLTTAESSGVGIRIVRDGRTGISYAGTLDRESISRAIEEARDNSRFGTPDEFAGVAEPDGVEPPAMSSKWSHELLSTPMDKKIALARDLERLTRRFDGRIRSLNSSNYGESAFASAIINSNGIERYSEATYCWAYAHALAGDGDESQSGFGMSAAKKFDEIDIEFAATEAATKATRMLGAKKPRSMRTTVIFEPEVTRSFTSIVAGTLSAERVQKGRSFFANRIGEAVASSKLTLVDDPTDERFFSAVPIDDEGLASRRNVMIERGELKGYFYDTYTARKAGVKSTGSANRGGIAGSTSPGPRGCYFEAGTTSREDLIKSVDSAILIQSISGVHSGVNPISGDFSVGAEGVVNSKGELGDPIKEFTISSTIQKMLGDVQEVASDLTFRLGAAAGMTLAIQDVSLSGN